MKYLSAHHPKPYTSFIISTLVLLFISACKKERNNIIIKPVSGTHLLGYAHKGQPREYYLYIPEGLPEKSPVVFVLHGHGRTANAIMDEYGMNAVADREGFIVCYPQGLPDNANITHWNAKLNISSTDDIGFLTGLAKHLQFMYNTDSLRTFIAGMSNGGFMCHTLACERPDIFRAAASVAGSMSGATWRTCNTNIPIPFLQIHGTADKRIPIDGSLSPEGGWGGAPSIDKLVDFIAAKNSCSVLDSSLIKPGTHFYRHKNIQTGNEVWYYKIDSGEHIWPKIIYDNSPGEMINPGIDATEEIWKFFSKY